MAHKTKRQAVRLANLPMRLHVAVKECLPCARATEIMQPLAKHRASGPTLQRSSYRKNANLRHANPQFPNSDMVGHCCCFLRARQTRSADPLDKTCACTMRESLVALLDLVCLCCRGLGLLLLVHLMTGGLGPAVWQATEPGGCCSVGLVG